MAGLGCERALGPRPRRRCSIGVASVVTWSQRWRATGLAEAKPIGGWRQLLLKRARDRRLARVAEKPDLTLREMAAELSERGTPASYGAV